LAEWLEHWQMVPALMVTGMVAGWLAGLIGVGGGIVVVPVLYFLFQQFGMDANSAITVATGTSLATIVPTSFSSVRAHFIRHHVDLPLLKRWGWAILAGVMAGGLLSARVGGIWLTALFGVLALVVSANMLLRTRVRPLGPRLPGVVVQWLLAGLIGMLSVMVGIGGGSMSVPLLTAFNFPTHRAVGTASAIGLLISLPGALTLLLTGITPADAPIGTFGLVNLVGFICIVPMTVLFAPIGAALGSRLDPTRLRQICALVLAITGVRMLMSVF